MNKCTICKNVYSIAFRTSCPVCGTNHAMKIGRSKSITFTVNPIDMSIRSINSAINARPVYVTK